MPATDPIPPAPPAPSRSAASTPLAARLAAAALTLLLPVDCALCGERDTALCNGCATALTRAQLASPERRRPVAVPFPVFAAAEYDGIVREAIISYKELDRSDLKRPLSILLATAVRDVLTTFPQETLHVVTIPSAARRTAERGFDHVAALLGGVRPRPLAHRWLRASTTRRDQVGLDATQRAQNAALGFTVPSRHQRSRRLVGARVLLIDDLVTTGSTLHAAADALAACGANVVAAAVVAHTPKRSGNLQP